MLSMTFEYGIMISYLAILDQSLSSLGYEDPGQITAVTILSATVVGIFSTFIFSSTIKRTLMYKNIIGLCNFKSYLRYLFRFCHFCCPSSHLYKSLRTLVGNHYHWKLYGIFLHPPACTIYGILLWNSFPFRWGFSNRVYFCSKSDIWVSFRPRIN